MSESTQSDGDRSQPMKRTTDLATECLHFEEFSEHEIRKMERFLKAMGSPSGKRKNKMLATFLEQHGEEIRREYCLHHCSDTDRCNKGQMYLNQRARRLRFPIYTPQDNS